MKKIYSLILVLLHFHFAALGQQTVQIGNGNSVPSNTLYSPVYRFSATSTTGSARSNMIFEASELAAVGIVQGTYITKIAFNKMNVGAFNSGITYEVRIGNSQNTPPLQGVVHSNWTDIINNQTLVFSSTNFNVPNNPGWMEIVFDAPFLYTGGSIEISTFQDMTGVGATSNFTWEYTEGFSGHLIGSTSTSSSNVVGYKHRPNIRFSIMGGVECDDQPLAENITGPSQICPNTPFSLQGETSLANGLSIVWQRSVAGADSWEIIPNAEFININVFDGISEDTEFRYIVTCTHVGLSDTSDVYLVTLENFINCYCIPTGSSNNTDEIRNFSLSNLNHSTPASEGTSGYSDYTTTVAPAELIGGEGYVASLLSGGGTGNHGAAIWIDWNDNGIFEANEKMAWIANTITANTTVQFSEFLVPMIPGEHRLRVQYHYLKSGEDLLPCTTTSIYSETEDYLVNVSLPTACSGAPVINSLVVDDEICPTVPFQIFANTDNYSNVEYKWQSSPVGQDDWTDVGITNIFYYDFSQGITVSTDYRLILTCLGSDLSDTSAVYTVIVTDLFDCYCTPPAPTYLDLYWIDSVQTFGGITNISNLGTGFSTGGYINYSSSHFLETVPMSQFILEVDSRNGSSPGLKVWIDWNQNGVFESNELVYNTTQGSTSSLNKYTINLEVPLDAVLGETMMRIRNYTSTNPCAQQSYGETEDYKIVINPLLDCTDANAGIISSTVSEVCSDEEFVLSSTGYSTPAYGLVYQWQSAPSGSNTWTDIQNANSVLYQGIGVDEDTDFRLKVTCSFGNQEDISNVVTINKTPVIDCYCTPPTPTYLDLYWIDSVQTFGGIANISNLGTGFSTGGYNDYSSSHFLETEPMGEFVLKVDSRNGSSPGLKVWIDWNQNGIFESDELVYNTTQGSTSSLNTYTVNLEVPIDAVPGETKMRIRNYTSTNPCAQQSYGETEDYKIVINPLLDCTDANAGTISSSVSEACSTEDFLLSVSGNTPPAYGLIYQWQSAPSGSNTWIDIQNANSVSYTAPGVDEDTDFRLKLTCTLEDVEGISNVLTITQSAITDCYCVPQGTNSNYYINNFITYGGVENISNLNTGFSPGGYHDYRADHRVVQYKESEIQFEGNYSSPNTFGTKIWVDWDQNGVFETDEVVFASASYVSTQVGSFVIPSTALAGETVMRVGISYTPNTGPANPCGSGSFEFEDYTLEVLEVPACDTLITPQNWALTALFESFCEAVDVRFDLSEDIFGAGVTFQYQRSLDGQNWVDVGVATSETYFEYEDLSTNMYFRALWFCNGVLVDSSEMIEMRLVVPEVISVVSDSRCDEGELNLSASVAAGTQAAWYDHPEGVGTPLFIGEHFTTPFLDQTTSYWVKSYTGAKSFDALTTISTGGTSCSGGIMFNITPTADLQVDSLLARAGGNVNLVNVYYRVGGYQGFETNQGEWILHEAVSTSATNGTMASIVLSNPILMEVGQVYGIYLNYNASYTTGSSTIPNIHSDANMVIESGAGLCGNFSSINSIRIFNGTVFYSIESCYSDTEEVVAEIVEVPEIGLDDEINICEGEEIVIDAGSGYDDYLWSTNETTSSIIVSTPGIYSVEVSIQGCTVVEEFEVFSIDAPISELVDTVRLCEGEQVILDPGNEGLGYEFLWSNGATTRIISVDQSGTYIVSIDNGYCVVEDEVYVDVVLQSDGESIHNTLIEEKKFQFHVVNPINVEEYFWDFGDGNTSTESEPIHEYDEFGIYEVKVYLNQDFCDLGATLMRHMIVEPISVDEIIKSENLVQLYPNPAKDRVTIQIDESYEIFKVKVFDIQGRLIMDMENVSSSSLMELNTSILASGMYQIAIQTDKGMIHRKLEIIR